MDQDELQSLTLKLLSGRVDARLGRGQHYLAEEIRKAADQAHLPREEIQEVMWSLVGQGLAYIDFSQPAPENWALRLTRAGKAAAADEEFTPNDPAGYMSGLIEAVPGLSDTVLKYAKEALHAYSARLYLASTVMLGVASEAAFLELAREFSRILDGNTRKNFDATLQRKSTGYLAKFGEFRRRLEPLKPKLPPELADGLTLNLDAVLGLLRVYRNDVGHPSAVVISRADCFTNLRLFARYIQVLYSLKSHFASAAASEQE